METRKLELVNCNLIYSNTMIDMKDNEAVLMKWYKRSEYHLYIKKKNINVFDP